ASGDRHAEAERLLEDARALWPRDVALLKRLGDLYESTGRRDDALQAREAALTIDGGDLTLRRSVWRARTGRELLSEHAVTREAALANYRAQPGSEEAASTYVLDAAATQAFADGSTVDRIHIIQKALDSSGVSEIAEVNIPSGAQVLSLRTLKADGTTLEPETIEGKEAVSLPGVQVGDAVEYEYLQAHPARGPAQPGFTAASFYFQIARAPNHWSTYTVVAPEGSGLAVDAHNTAAAAPVKQGGYEIFKHDARRVPPFVPEPNAPPSPNEYLPFVSIGAKAQGNEGLLREYADDTLDGGQRTFEVEQFARAAAGNKKGKEAVRALYAAVMERLSGRDAGLGLPAAASLAQDRGSRLWALKAGLEVLGVPTRIAAVRTFAVDPAPYRFPNEALFTYVCLRAQVGGEEVWLDPLVRFAPFGELPEPARGREAYLLPEPGHPLKKVKTPSGSAIPLKQVALALTLSETGTLSGSGEEAYSGFEAAQLGEALDALSPEQRTQALQSALTQYFGGATLSQLNVDWP
ncbi:MAG TPA: DUF3857 domain-containing protein, partial [Myxococcaceae bacterium]|nr:DUF3857 domain-containing protein [Myxococcaceae bacterium]